MRSWIEAARARPCMAYALQAVEGYEEKGICRMFIKAAQELEESGKKDVIDWLCTRQKIYGLASNNEPNINSLHDHQVVALFALYFNVIGNSAVAEYFAVLAAYELGKYSESREHAITFRNEIQPKLEKRARLGWTASAEKRAFDRINKSLSVYAEVLKLEEINVSERDWSARIVTRLNIPRRTVDRYLSEIRDYL